MGKNKKQSKHRKHKWSNKIVKLLHKDRIVKLFRLAYFVMELFEQMKSMFV